MLMTLPAIIFGLLLSTLYGTAFHLWRGGSGWRLILYLVLGWAGFWLGQFIAMQLGWTFASLGSLHLGLATLMSAIFLFGGYWLSLVEVERK
jgi:uncharacterized membrane protein YeaQ/YmgE (transglycosylase-associated protein family)